MFRWYKLILSGFEDKKEMPDLSKNYRWQSKAGLLFGSGEETLPNELARETIWSLFSEEMRSRSRFRGNKKHGSSKTASSPLKGLLRRPYQTKAKTLRYKLPIDDNFFLIFSQRGKINNIFGALTPYSFHLNLKTELLPFTFKKN